MASGTQNAAPPPGLANRPDRGGERGRAVTLESNFYDLGYPKEIWFQYEVLFEPEGNRCRRIEVLKTLVKEKAKPIFRGLRPVFDGTRLLISREPLLDETGTELPMQKTFSISVKFPDGRNAQGPKFQVGPTGA
ncbi:hypothetical protein BDK51DRAFT_43333 [Blyttiomyces helicus]|uniref:Protein argonaute N-terminal domain-containing protein n=1 Tax=Blyttiomyces helicus TaxID=388810 RepID=A0A4P9VZQ6_9FUNG|nr:hypothetical protein BDK51DRAFT_43333 [Blyttiomyces helicus]|eukprot:RKO83770.1 hypothetical protein BDK51DRAFT_43333 [Blyttiomyces helicus]